MWENVPHPPSPQMVIEILSAIAACRTMRGTSTHSRGGEKEGVSRGKESAGEYVFVCRKEHLLSFLVPLTLSPPYRLHVPLTIRPVFSVPFDSKSKYVLLSVLPPLGRFVIHQPIHQHHRSSCPSRYPQDEPEDGGDQSTVRFLVQPAPNKKNPALKGRPTALSSRGVRPHWPPVSSRGPQ